MTPDFMIIANPTSGRGRGPKMAEDVLRILQKERSAELVLTTAAGDAAVKARAAAQAGVKVVIGCGGDGTLQEIAGALAHTKTAMGILPGGRCNDLAHVIGLHKKDAAEDLAKIILSPEVQALDLGSFESLASGKADEPKNLPSSSSSKKYFCTVATLGLDSQVSQYIEHKRLPIRGTAAYMWGLLQVLRTFKAIQVNLKGDFGEFSGRVVLMATGNTATYGGAMQITPGALPNDGLFNICILNEVTKSSILGILPRVFNGTHVKHPKVQLLQTKTLEIRTPDGPEWICADGETLGQTPAVLQVSAGCLKLKSKPIAKPAVK